VLPEVVREAAKPMEAIDSIKIVQVEGLSGGSNGGGGSGSGGEGNLASSAVAAALRYRAQAPIVDGLMKELGFDGSTLENLVAGAGNGIAAPAPGASDPLVAVTVEPKD
jgi:uncharacterized membrane protein YqiK